MQLVEELALQVTVVTEIVNGLWMLEEGDVLKN